MITNRHADRNSDDSAKSKIYHQPRNVMKMEMFIQNNIKKIITFHSSLDTFLYTQTDKIQNDIA